MGQGWEVHSCCNIYIPPSSQLSALIENALVYSYCVKGFTLMELMLVVAIVGVVIGLLMPAVMGAIDQANRVKCRVVIRSYARDIQEGGRLIIEIPQEANCHDCHRPRYDARLYLRSIDP